MGKIKKILHRLRRYGNEDPVARGISVRELDSGQNIRIDFIYRGVRCRETLKIEPTKANLKYAERLRGEILNTISLGTFNYPDYFPDSKRAKLFGYSVVIGMSRVVAFIITLKNVNQNIT